MPMISKIISCGLDTVVHKARNKFKVLPDPTGENSVEGKVVVITGANGGVGKTLTLQMALRKAVVVMACRDLMKAETVRNEIKELLPAAQIHLLKLDLSKLETVRLCAVQIIEKFTHVNLLICAAGYLGVGKTIERTKDGLEKHLAINHLGHFLLSLLLLNHLKKGAPSRIVCVSASSHVWSPLDPGNLNYVSDEDETLGFMNLHPYNRSKLCNTLFVRELGRRLEGTQVSTYCLCPGLIRTDFFKNFPWFAQFVVYKALMNTIGTEPEKGAETVIYCALSEQCSHESGRIYRFRQNWTKEDEKLEEMDELGKQVWEASEELVGFKFEEVIAAGFPNVFLSKYKVQKTELGQGQKVIPMILGRAYRNKISPLGTGIDDKLSLFID